MKKKKLYIQQKKRYLNKIVGSNLKPRLSVFRSHKHIYAQLIDDFQRRTLASCCTLEKQMKNKLETKSLATKQVSYIIGEELAKRAKQKQISQVCFDRGNRPYHGRIQSLAEGARNQGLIF